MNHESEGPGELEDTDSYDLPQVGPEESGPVQPVRPNKLPDIQWKSASKTVEESLVDGLSNEDWWLLIRRFNKQIYYVKSTTAASPRVLDLNRADDEGFPPEKLRITLERFYTSVIVGISEFCSHVVRLRSWDEHGRTLAFCTAYFTAWYMELLVPTVLSILAALILYPPMRPLLFPARAVQDRDTGATRKSPAQTAESQDSITGAPERHKGEAAEQEANNLVNSVASVASASAAAKYGQGVVDDASEELPGPETAEVVETAADEQTEDAAEDKTKKPMKKKVSQATDRTMRVVSDITDIYERFANLFSPTPPFYLITPRLYLAGTLLAVSLVVPFISSDWIIKAGGFVIGFGFFGDPVFKHTEAVLNRHIPDWKKSLDLQNTLLKEVPTNAQLTLTLLRIGEIEASPLPPPPSSPDNEPSWPLGRKKSKALIGDKSNRQEGFGPPPGPESKEAATGTKPKRRWAFKVLKFVRRTIGMAIDGHIAFDSAMAIAGAAHTQNLIGMLHQRRWIAATPFRPLKFEAKFERKRGAVVIDSSQEPPILYFTTDRSAGLDDVRLEGRKKGSVLFQIPVVEIQELKKTEGLGWKGKLIVELTAGSKEAADGLVIVGKEPGQSYHLTGMRARNQLFNRLVAIGAQFWESR